MTRILYWNLNNFSQRKIDINVPAPNHIRPTWRLTHIVHEVVNPIPPPPLPANSPPAPDMIVIAECFSRVREVGHPGGAIGSLARVGRGLRLLLDEFRLALGPTWCLVPPLMLGDLGLREGVAVYYNAATLTFTGPWVYSWDAAAGVNRGRALTAATFANRAPYTFNWLQALPDPVNASPPLQLNRSWLTPFGNVEEWCGAGQWQFQTAAGAAIHFPAAQNRPPFYTRMQENAPGGRTLKVFTVHTSPATADQATQNIGQIQELAIAAGEVGVVLGDFNVDSFSTVHNPAYNPLRGLGYTPLIEALDAAGNAVWTRKRYCLTHLLPERLATPFNSVGVPRDPQHNRYPRFGYMGSTRRNPVGGPWIPSNKGAIDNVFVRYPAGAAVPAHNTTIVNTIVGKPYNAVPPPVGVGPNLTGGYAYNASLANPIPLPAGVNAAAGLGTFRNWANFGYISGTSDHLAVIVDI